MDVKLLNQNPRLSSRPNVFQFAIFLTIALIESRCMFASEPFSSLSTSFFSSNLSIQHFRYVPFPYFTPKLFRFFYIWLLICFGALSTNFVRMIFFRYFGRSCFVCIAYLCIGTFWVFLYSPISFLFPGNHTCWCLTKKENLPNNGICRLGRPQSEI